MQVCGSCAIAVGLLSSTPRIIACTTVYFNSLQHTNMVTSATTSDTINSEGYLFTYTRDKLFTGGVGLTNPVGRYLRVNWPDGLEAQSVTAGPSPGAAKMTIKRQDNRPFAIEQLRFKLLANTGGAGASFEIMPRLNGEDMRNDPFMYNATGYYGQLFSYITPELTGADSYLMNLYVDFAIMSITIVDDAPEPPMIDLVPVSSNRVQLSWTTNSAGFVLQSCTNLTTQTWLNVTNKASTNVDVYTLELDTTGPTRYYRLKN